VKYCPNCGAEYLPGVDRCYDCQVPLADDPPAPAVSESPSQASWGEVTGSRPLSEVFRSGRQMDAELVRARLEGAGYPAVVWGSGMGPWRLEAGLTQMTGVPNPFNAYRVMVDEECGEEARAFLGQKVEPLEDDWDESDGSKLAKDPTGARSGERDETSLAWLRRDWMLFALALVLLLIIVLVGRIG
jgi:hypothetical protein